MNSQLWEGLLKYEGEFHKDTLSSGLLSGTTETPRSEYDRKEYSVVQEMMTVFITAGPFSE